MTQGVEIKVIVNKDGTTGNISLGGLSYLQAAFVLSQVIVQLHAKALQQSGSSMIATPASMPGLRLS